MSLYMKKYVFCTVDIQIGSNISNFYFYGSEKEDSKWSILASGSIHPHVRIDVVRIYVRPIVTIPKQILS